MVTPPPFTPTPPPLLALMFSWIDEFSDDQELPGPVFRVTPATNPITQFGIGIGLNSAASFRYQSTNQSMEVLGRGNSEYFNFIYGFRYLNLTETLEVGVTTNPFFDPTFVFRTQNDLYGFQLGIDGDLLNASRFSIGYFLKAGIYYNDVSVSWQVPPILRTSGGASQGVASFVAEAGLSDRYDICRNLSLTAVYRFLFLDGVSLAADQVPNTGDMALNPIAMNID